MIGGTANWRLTPVIKRETPTANWRQLAPIVILAPIWRQIGANVFGANLVGANVFGANVFDNQSRALDNEL